MGEFLRDLSRNWTLNIPHYRFCLRHELKYRGQCISFAEQGLRCAAGLMLQMGSLILFYEIGRVINSSDSDARLNELNIW